jgi:cysteine-rich repeat protein
MSCNGGEPSYLVTVDPSSGAVAVIGETINSLTGIAFDLYCGDGIVSPGEGCDDGNTANGDCCSAACVPAVDGTSCSDGLFCNGAEACAAGLCAGGTPPCAASCDESGDACIGGCPPVAPVCRVPGRSTLTIRDRDNNARDVFAVYRPLRGRLRRPSSTAGYSVCIAACAALIGSSGRWAVGRPWVAAQLQLPRPQRQFRGRIPPAQRPKRACVTARRPRSLT